MKTDEPLSIEELTDIFNTILDSHCFRLIIPAFGGTPRDYYEHLEWGGTHEEFEKKQLINREKFSKYFTNKELIEIEYKLIVFENIPRNIIYKIIEDFLEVIYQYAQSKEYKRNNSKELTINQNKIRKKDIRIIEDYQKMIFNYTSDYDYNDDSEYSILSSALDNVYDFNKSLLEELKTRKYKILDPYRYEGVKLYDSSKRKIKSFFKELKNKYNMKTSNIKDMIDII